MQIDRTAPTCRPSEPAAGTQQWRNLLFLHWEVSAEQLRPLVPDALALDAFDGRYYIGLVPFAMFKVKPSWLPEPLSFDFLETNLRTYVHYEGRNPGVYFFSLDAASRLAVEAARVMTSLPYFKAEMSFAKHGLQAEYALNRTDWRSPEAALSLRYEHDAETSVSSPGTLGHFLFERYYLFVEKSQRLLRLQVHHPPYAVANAKLLRLEETLSAAANLRFQGPPPLVHYSPGVDVEVFAPHPAEA